MMDKNNFEAYQAMKADRAITPYTKGTNGLDADGWIREFLAAYPTEEQFLEITRGLTLTPLFLYMIWRG